LGVSKWQLVDWGRLNHKQRLGLFCGLIHTSPLID
jgi:hypothetical protein